MTTIVLLILAYAQIKDSFGTIGTPQIATQALPNAATAGTLSSGASDLLLTASFIFALFVLLGNRYMKERSARQRMSVLRLMVEKGQPISENLVREMMAGPESKKTLTPLEARQKQLRKGLAFIGVGVALCAYRVLGSGAEHEDALVLGLPSLGLGIGLLFAYKFSGNHTQS